MHDISKRSAAQIKWVSKWPAFKAAKSVLELGAGSFETLSKLAQDYPEKNFFGVDFTLRSSALDIIKTAPNNLHVLKGDVRNLEVLHKNSFDFAFSIALVEHIRELDDHLKCVHRVLKRGGYYNFMASPLWSSSLGHHCDHNAPNCLVPHYGHLYMTRETLGDWMVENKGESREKIEQILRRIYDRHDLSRLSYSQIINCVDKSSFRIKYWRVSKDKNFDSWKKKLVIKNNLYKISPKDLRISGVVCSLKKNCDHQYPIWRSWVRRVSGI